MAPQPPPFASQRSHWYAYDVGEPVHVPELAVRSDPSRAVPEIDGSFVFDGFATVVVVAAVVVVVEVVAATEADPTATETVNPTPRSTPRAATWRARLRMAGFCPVD